MKVKKILKLFLSLIAITLIYFAISSSTVLAMDVTDNSIREITDLGELDKSTLGFLASDMNNEKLVILVYTLTHDSENIYSNYYLMEYNTETAALVKIKEIDINDKLRTDDSLHCAIRDDGSIILTTFYKSQKLLVYDKDFNYVETETIEKSMYEQICAKSEQSIFYTNGFIERECTWREVSDLNIVYFHDDLDHIYTFEADGFNYIADKNHKIFKGNYIYQNNTKALSLRVYDYIAENIKSLEIQNFDDSFDEARGNYNTADISLNDNYVFFIISTKNGKVPYLWKYSDSETLNFDVKKFDKTGFEKENASTIKNLKSKYNIDNIYIDKKSDYTYKVNYGSNPIDVYNVLFYLEEYLEELPKDLIKDIKNTKLNKEHKFNIYLIKEFKEKDKNGYTISSSTSTSKKESRLEISTTFSSRNYLPSSFIKLMDQRIIEYYKNKNKDWNKMWNNLKSKDKRASKLTSIEDRANVFEHLDSSVWPLDFPNHKERAKLLCNSLRLAFPSIYKCTSTYWEKWVMLPTLKVSTKTKTNTISVSWEKTKEGAEYIVQRKKGNNWETIDVDIDNNSFSITNLKAGTKYSYRIRSFTLESNRYNGEDAIRDYKVYSDWVNIEVATKPSTPTIKSTKSYKNSIVLKWKAVSKGTGYQIKYIANGKTTKKFVTNIKSTKYTIKNLKSKKKYKIQIRAYKSVNGQKFYSDWSKVSTIKTK